MMFLISFSVATLYWLDQIESDHHAAVGLKALHLNDVQRIQCPVLPGFVIASHVLPALLRETPWGKLLCAGTDAALPPLSFQRDDGMELQTIAKQFRQAIADTPLPEDLVHALAIGLEHLSAQTVILRPSLIVEPFHRALMHPLLTELMVHPGGLLSSQVCAADVPAVVSSLKQMWGDFLGAKSLFCWQQLNISLHQVRLGVLVQPIQSAIAAGTLRWHDQQIEVCAVAGLGFAIARSEVTPDTYHVDPAVGVIVSQHLGQKSIAYQIAASPQVGASEAPAAIAPGEVRRYLLEDAQQYTFALAEEQVWQLVRRFQAVTQAMGREVEVEWVLIAEAGQVQDYVTQLIPLTAAARPAPEPPVLTDLPAISANLLPEATLIATGVAVSSGQAIAVAHVLPPPTVPLDPVPPQAILVARTMPLDWLPLLQNAAGLISEQGGATSHSAIVAREAGVPAVMGVAKATHQVRSGELLWLDGDRGRIYRLPQTTNVPVLPPVPMASSFSPDPIARLQAPLGTRLWVNLSQFDRLERVANFAVDGVGLLRSELLMLTVFNHQHPAVWLQHRSEQDFVDQMAAAIANVASAFYPRPVLYRSFDLRSQEFTDTRSVANAPSSGPESVGHPALGVRGTLSYLLDDRLFRLELLALSAVQQRGFTNVHLMLPFVRTLEEFHGAHQLVQQSGLMNHASFQLWMMAEVPSVLLLLPEYVQAGVQGISIGTNDLTQLLLGIDREDAQLSAMYEERHPAVKRAIAQLIQMARSLGISCSICGEAPARYPELIFDLIRWGIDSISVAPEAIATTYREMLRAEQKILLEKTRSQSSPDEKREQHP